MSLAESSPPFCLFCLKSSENPFLDQSTDGMLERTQKFTRVLNAFSSQEIGKKFNKFLKTFSENENNKVLNYCSDCDSIIDQLCEIHDQIKSLEEQFKCQLGQLGNIINYANGVPSKWVNISNYFGKRVEIDGIAAAQNGIRDFRETVLKAAQNRKQDCEADVSLKRPVNPSSDSSLELESTENKKTKLEARSSRSLLPEECPKCPMKFRNIQTLSVHLKHHKAEEEPIWECSECLQTFSRPCSIAMHKKSHSSGEKPFKCQFCGQPFINLQSLNKHLRTEHGYHEKDSNELIESSQETLETKAVVVKLEPDSLLSNLEEDANNLDAEYWWENSTTISPVIKQEVQEQVANPPTQSASTSTSASALRSKPVYECEICSKNFKSFLIKERHFKLFHDLEGKAEDTQIYKCEMEGCKAYFLKELQLKGHYNLHSDHQVSAVFKEKGDRSSKGWTCGKCGRTFATNIEFMAHIGKLRNSSCATFECKVCGEKFKHLVKLNEHVRKEHGNEMGFNYQAERKGNEEKVKVGKEEMNNCFDEEGDEMEMDEDGNTFGRNLGRLDDGNLAELEDLD